MPLEKSVGILQLELPEIIKSTAKQYRSEPYFQNPDYLDPRLFRWHEFGLLTHTRKVKSAFNSKVWSYLREFGCEKEARACFDKKVDEEKKKDIFDLSILLHDLGKAACYADRSKNRHHEVASKNLMLQGELRERLLELGVSDTQLQLAARYVETHVVLGRDIRDYFQDKNNFDLGHLNDPKVRGYCKELICQNPDVASELGIFFLCDSLGKTDAREFSNEGIREYISRKKARPELEEGIRMLPVNIRLSEIYLRSVFKETW